MTAQPSETATPINAVTLTAGTGQRISSSAAAKPSVARMMSPAVIRNTAALCAVRPARFRASRFTSLSSKLRTRS